MHDIPLVLHHRMRQSGYTLRHGGIDVAQFPTGLAADTYCLLEFGRLPLYDLMLMPIREDDDIIEDEETGVVQVFLTDFAIGYFSNKALYLGALWESKTYQ